VLWPVARRGLAWLDPDGKRIRRKVSGRTKEDVKEKLGKLHSDLEVGIRTPAARYTVAQAVEDWLREGLDGRSAKTVTLDRQVLQPVVDCIGRVGLRELRTSFVSLMSSSGVPVEEIARLAGHSSSRTTEVVYRRELRPVITTGAQVMDKIFSA